MRDLHLWKNKARAAEFVLFVTQGRSAAVQPPIPEREDNHIRQPEQSARAQQLERRLLM